MTHPNPPIMRAADELNAALDRLDDAAEAMMAAMRKSDLNDRRIQPLLQSAARHISPSDRDKMMMLTGRQRTLQKSLKRTQDALETCHEAYAGRLERARAAVADQEAAIEALYQKLARQKRLEGALKRSLVSISDQYLRDQVRAFEDDGFDLPAESHTYIQSDLASLFQMMIELDVLLASDDLHAAPNKRYRPVRFLEVGCGPGRNLHMIRAAEILDCADLTGFDINHVMVDAGRAAYGLEDNLSVADALTFDYAPYDVIFSYRPFVDLTVQQQLEARMAATMKNGAYLLAPLPYDLTLYPDLQPRGTIADIWRKDDGQRIET